MTRLYLMLGAALVLAALVATVFYYRGNAISAAAERDKAYAELRKAVEANRTNLDVIARLRAEAAENDRIVAEMAAQLEALAASVDQANKALQELSDSNADVRSYLDTPVPGELRRLYDRKAGGGGAH